ncbi:hypothetical protein M8542_36345 [Amycolatopsis sp. OK19-0408]|uniref:Uncharacterized protein n=1 Tax=Amycolatopsis iheyensis TaxID=2945988 RepID=A0A9X2NIZ5_9PSEU|nr:hypothetical protein [Amycolatopsis iheyensis]MCR6488316.1 hypothetical protein [Amycolatopsis iheyensis]
MERITTAFTGPGAHVVLVDTGTAATTITPPATGDPTAPGEGVPAAVRAAVHALGRTVTTPVLDTRADSSATPSQPFWANLIHDAASPTGTPADPTTSPARDAAIHGRAAPCSWPAELADLMLVSLSAHAAERVSIDRLALRAAGLLRLGGIFAVYTHSDWNGGRLLDPTGAIVAAAQHADLLYLQHIVVLHTPVRAGRLHAAPSASMAAEYDRTAHRATVRGMPAPHLRAHGDVLVFAQPASPAGSPLTHTAEVPAPGDRPGPEDQR